MAKLANDMSTNHFTCRQELSSTRLWVWTEQWLNYYKIIISQQCMKRPVAHLLNSTWFWIELPENCCEPLKCIMKYISIQFCERPGHGRPFHALSQNIAFCVPLVPNAPKITSFLAATASTKASTSICEKIRRAWKSFATLLKPI